jgi:hypothetical protein
VLADGFAWTQDLSQPLGGRVCNHGHPLGWAQILRAASAADQRPGFIVKSTSQKSIRCAIYTRVSTEAGLDQDFNSLDAQYDGAQAYIHSQAHAGWTLLRGKYDRRTVWAEGVCFSPFADITLHNHHFAFRSINGRCFRSLEAFTHPRCKRDLVLSCVPGGTRSL